MENKNLLPDLIPRVAATKCDGCVIVLTKIDMVSNTLCVDTPAVYSTCLTCFPIIVFYEIFNMQKSFIAVYYTYLNVWSQIY